MTGTEHSAWNPGIESDIPSEYKKWETIYLSENTVTDFDEILELARVTGLSHEELIQFRPERLVLHEVIIRITAEIAIAESDVEEDLGISFRQIADKIIDEYIQPNIADIKVSYETMQQEARSAIEEELVTSLFTPDNKVTHQNKSLWQKLSPFTRATSNKPASSSFTQQEREFAVICRYKEKGLNSNTLLTAAVYRSLYRVLGSIAGERGYLGRDLALLVELSTRHVCNYYGARLIGEKVNSLMIQAISEQEYPVIPDADEAILISLKGTSAAGKSSLRPGCGKLWRGSEWRAAAMAPLALIFGGGCCWIMIRLAMLISMQVGLPAERLT